MPDHDGDVKGRGGLDRAGIRRRYHRVEAGDLYDGHRRVVHDDRGPYAVSVPPLLDVDARPEGFRAFVDRWASDPFPAGRAAELAGQGHDTDLPLQDRVVAVWWAATREETERRVEERESLKPLVNRVTEEADHIVRRASGRREGKRIGPDEDYDEAPEGWWAVDRHLVDQLTERDPARELWEDDLPLLWEALDEDGRDLLATLYSVTLDPNEGRPNVAEASRRLGWNESKGYRVRDQIREAASTV